MNHENDYNLSSKPKLILHSLFENGENKWYPVKSLIMTTWGDSACDTEKLEKKWRRNLSSQLNLVKSKIAPKFLVERNRSLDAVRIIRNPMECELEICSRCNTGFPYLGLPATKKFCIDCLCIMMDLCAGCDCDPCDCNWGTDE
jgi:hypothetical protein